MHGFQIFCTKILTFWCSVGLIQGSPVNERPFAPPPWCTLGLCHVQALQVVHCECSMVLLYLRPDRVCVLGTCREALGLCSHYLNCCSCLPVRWGLAQLRQLEPFGLTFSHLDYVVLLMWILGKVLGEKITGACRAQKPIFSFLIGIGSI